jgi:hypothetical protein
MDTYLNYDYKPLRSTGELGPDCLVIWAFVPGAGLYPKTTGHNADRIGGPLSPHVCRGVGI